MTSHFWICRRPKAALRPGERRLVGACLFLVRRHELGVGGRADVAVADLSKAMKHEKFAALLPKERERFINL